jgi:hypothetical protein
VLAHHEDVELGVLRDLEDAFVLEHGLQPLERLFRRHLALDEIAAAEEIAAALAAMEQRRVGGLARRERKGEAHEIGLHRVEAVGLRVEGDVALLARFGQPAVERIE